MIASDETPALRPSIEVNRRRFIQLTTATATTALASGLILPSHAAADDTPPSLEAARNEGPMVYLHSDQESDAVEFLTAFTAKTGIAVKQQRLLPGIAYPRLQAEFRAGQNPDVDVFSTSDVGMFEELRKQNRLMRYVSSEFATVPKNEKSDPEGFWTCFYIGLSAMMYNPTVVPAAEAPKTWMDLLDPRWKGQIGVQTAAAGSQYEWWYALKQILPADFWPRFAEQKPRAYASSTQTLADIQTGNLKIGAKVSTFAYYQAIRANRPIGLVLPPEGTPANRSAMAILAGSKRPNAAKIFIDYYFSREGQQKWYEIEGNYPIRADVKTPELPPLPSIKMLVPEDFADFAAAKRHAEFVTLWNKITGL